MTHKHTPGPWTVSAQPNGPQWVISADYSVGGVKLSNGRQAICSSPAASVRYASGYAEMFKANAKLIAAAPDLLLALEAMLQDVIFDGTDAVIAARAAIAKATS